MKKLALFLILIGILTVVGKPSYAFADLSSCTADIDTPSLNINDTGVSVTFSVTNQDDADGRMHWVKVSTPTSDFTIENYGNNETFTGFDAGVNSPANIGVIVDVGGTPVSTSNWKVEISDSYSGDNPVTCTGNLGMQIIDPNVITPTPTPNTTGTITIDSAVLGATTNVLYSFKTQALAFLAMVLPFAGALLIAIALVFAGIKWFRGITHR